jgi:hypothetical protein
MKFIQPLLNPPAQNLSMICIMKMTRRQRQFAQAWLQQEAHRSARLKAMASSFSSLSGRQPT